MTTTGWLWFVFGVSTASLLVAALFAREVLQSNDGTKSMQSIAAAIREGAQAFLRRQYMAIYGFSCLLAILIYIFYALTKNTELAAKTVISFFAGAICSG